MHYASLGFYMGYLFLKPHRLLLLFFLFCSLLKGSSLMCTVTRFHNQVNVQLFGINLGDVVITTQNVVNLGLTTVLGFAAGMMVIVNVVK